MSDFKIDPSYNEVPERIRQFREKYPEGCLRPVDPAQPFQVVTIGNATFIAYAAAAYRSPEDTLPGIGCAWEQFPGKTPYTRDSELMNAETSAWGRALIAVLAADAKKVASREDVEKSRARQEQRTANKGLRREIADLARDNGMDLAALSSEFANTYGMQTADATVEDLQDFLDVLRHRLEGRAAITPAPTNVPEAETQGEGVKAQGTPPGDGKPPSSSGGPPPHEFYAGSPGGPCRECDGPKDAAWHIEPDAEWFRDALLAAKTRYETKRLYHRALAKGHGDTVVADANGVAVTLEDLGQQRIKETA